MAVGISQHQGFTAENVGSVRVGFGGAAEGGEQGAGTLEMAGDRSPVLECGDTKTGRLEPPGRQIQGQVMPPFPKRNKMCRPFCIPGHSVLR